MRTFLWWLANIEGSFLIEKNSSASWTDYYAKNGCPTRLDMFASVLHNATYLFQILGVKPQSILEIGSGRGLHSIFLSYFIHRVVGIDIEGELVENSVRLNRRFRGRAHFLKMDAFNTSFTKDAFSVCCSQGFFEHFKDSDINALFEELFRVTRTVIFSVPSNHYPKKNLGNERLLNIQEWKEILKNYQVNGFYYGPTIDTSLGIIRNLKPKTMKKIFASPKKGQICIKVKPNTSR